jgi:3-hydroxymyristoyl/3-hydroxydecanoyl-(acyl carrier protein) dehydratase
MTDMEFVVDASHPSLPGHVPGEPIVPGVVLLDHVVEAIEAAHGPLARLRLPQVKFLQPLRPGEPARVELDGAAPRWRFRVWRGDALLASGDAIDGDAP